MTRTIPPALLEQNRSADYPVTLVAATYAPAVEVKFATSGKKDAAKQSATGGVVQCSPALLGGVYGLIIFTPCALLSSAAGGAVSAWRAESGQVIDAMRTSAQATPGYMQQDFLLEKVQAYLDERSGKTVQRATADVTGPASADDKPVYHTGSPTTAGTLLELSLLKASYSGSGQSDALVCLQMTARGRKLDAATGQVIEERGFAVDARCEQIEQWLSEGGIHFKQAVDYGYRMLAESIADRFYLVYYPQRQASEPADAARKIPDFVLAPVSPPAPEMYLDLKAISHKPKHQVGLGGMHFVDINNLTPTFRWESFPRPFDAPPGGHPYSDIRYDIRIYNAIGIGQLAIPNDLLQEANNLTEPLYALQTSLQPCRQYYWTVRASFLLDGTRRVTEWAGAYNTLGGEVAPSNAFYYPFRTPGSDDQASCW